MFNSSWWLSFQPHGMELHRSSFNLDLFLKSDEESHEAQKSNESKQKLFCSTFFLSAPNHVFAGGEDNWKSVYSEKQKRLRRFPKETFKWPKGVKYKRAQQLKVVFFKGCHHPGGFFYWALITSRTGKANVQSTNTSHTWIDVVYRNHETKGTF